MGDAGMTDEQDDYLTLCQEFAKGWMVALSDDVDLECVAEAVEYGYDTVTTNHPLDVKAGYDVGHTSGQAYRLRQAAVDRYGKDVVDRYPNPGESA